MSKKNTIALIISILVLVVIILIINYISKSSREEKNVNNIKATVLNIDDTKTTVIDDCNNIYQFKNFDISLQNGDNILIKYTGFIDNLKDIQNATIVSLEQAEIKRDENGIPISWKDNGLFSDYYIMAYNKLKTLSLDEKIGQLLLARYPDNNAIEDLKNYKLSGFVFFEKDFKNKDKKSVQTMINQLQSNANIPLITAVDEEGGTVVRISSNPLLASEKFKSPQELYALGGMEAIKQDTINKSKLLKELGLNLNLAPVVDVSTNPSDYIYNRTLGQNTQITSLYAKTVIEASKNTDISYTLKHFPGYGNNTDTHTSTSVDNRTYDDILNNDIPPFEEGIKALAEAVLVSHNIINNIDSTNPASLSPAIHNLLRTNLKFTGVVITDDIDMSAVNSITDKAIKAILAGNNLIITTNYSATFNEIKNAVENKNIDESLIDQLVFKTLAWKYYKGLMLQLK